MENCILFSQITLIVFSFASFAFAFFFLSKLKSLKNVFSNSLPPSVFDRSFVVFNPYSERQRIIHGFLLFLPALVFFFSMFLAFSLLFVIEAGVILSFFVAIVGLNLIVVGDAFEVYESSKVFIENLGRGDVKLGVGDLEALRLVYVYLPKLVKYYLILAFASLTLSAFFPFLVSPLLWGFSGFVGLILQASVLGGPVCWVVAVFLFAVPTVLVQLLSSKVKGFIFRYSAEMPRLKVSEAEERLV
jgi:hypothetical protein